MGIQNRGSSTRIYFDDSGTKRALCHGTDSQLLLPSLETANKEANDNYSDWTVAVIHGCDIHDYAYRSLAGSGTAGGILPSIPLAGIFLLPTAGHLTFLAEIILGKPSTGAGN